MSFKDFPINRSYINQGPGNFADAFLVPALKHTKLYERSVGFFSSGVFVSLLNGVMELGKNGGHIHLIASPQLNQNDIDAINTGYELREVAKNAAERNVREAAANLESLQLQILVDLIAEGILDVKIAVADSAGDYHDKLGILTDFSGNSIAFYGSPNESNNGYRENYEKIRLVRSWNEAENESVEDEKEEFKRLWNHDNEYVTTYEFRDSFKQNILKVVETKRQSEKQQTPIKLRDYQEAAIKAWAENGYRGFYTMATGTGKTWTAIYSAKELQKHNPALMVICAPYKHLIRQWAEDLIKAYPNATIIMVSSENPGWDKQISNALVAQRYDSDKQLIIVSTILSFNSDRFNNVIGKSVSDKLLIIDEAHRFSKRPDALKTTYKYMLGLSATPYSGSSATKGRELMDFFGGQVFSLPIEQALERGYLVPYEYHPIYVNASDDEERRFNVQTQIISSCFRNGVLIDADKLVKSLRNRLRIISMAEEKQSKIDIILNQVNEKDHLVVYCGDGKLYNDSTGEEIRHIQDVKRVLTRHGYKASQFTCNEDMHERMELVDVFNRQKIDALAAIRCLDEGINIPSIKAALILSSNDDYREFVQRRGRILRQYTGKASAQIYDVIVLPSGTNEAWAKIELRRFREYARLALNSDELMSELNSYLNQYGLSEDDVDVFDYEDMEDEIDE